MLHICIRNGKLTSLEFNPGIAGRSRRQFVIDGAVVMHTGLIQGLHTGERLASHWATIRQGSKSRNRWLEGNCDKRGTYDREVEHFRNERSLPICMARVTLGLVLRCP
jgi:hypothetical protein